MSTNVHRFANVGFEVWPRNLKLLELLLETWVGELRFFEIQLQ